jgi:hypothetical protein
MAEFKLGRIRFVWQGDWAAQTTYVADDVVSFGGKSYICIRNHTASTEFNTDFSNVIPKWDIVSDGTSWKADWLPEIEYAPGDVVKYGANVYICETGHISATFESPTFLGLEEDLSNWTEFATSFDWKSSWTSATRYKLNDLVRYGGYVYICNTAHVSAATTVLGLEVDSSKWTLFSDGVVYTGEWVTATRYRVNDLVKYGGNIWISTTAHTSSDFETETANWDSFIEGFQFEDSWNSNSNYQSGDTVTYGGYVYVARTNHTNSQPTANPADWDVFTTGFKFQGEYSALINYRVGDVVRLGGSTYVALSDSVDTDPSVDAEWSRLNSGINWTQSTETFLQVQGVNATGVSGSGARFDVVKSNTVYTVTISTGFAGIGYSEDDVVTISGANVGGTSPANDVRVVVTGVTTGAIDTVSYTGASSSWKSTVLYNVGDVVFYGASSFICVAKHTAATNNRPDNDVLAAYWNLLTLGSEALSLTTEGDLVYYGDNGPTRLPIGIDGQILRVTDGTPAWANYGLIDNVVYVGPLGSNEPAPASGLTVDKPWASVRYAMEQVRDGYLNPQAKYILKNNKEFLMKEVSNWISYTYRVVVTAASSGTQVFTTADTSNLLPGMPIVFDGTLGGITAGTIYYVDQATSATKFRISVVQNSGIPLSLTSATGRMTGNLAYNATKCERDTGYIIDALIYDISRGGTLKTVTAAKSYYTPAGNLYINSTFESQRDQTVAANIHLKNIINEVLANAQPLSYQSLNQIAIEDRAVQTIDTSLEAELIASSKAAGLMDIITVGLASGTATSIPAPTNPNTTVFIKTGTYNEVLPIIVPEYTAVVGDELRTSVVQPATANPVLVNDKEKRTGALNRIKSLLPDLMENIEITPTAGNTSPQQFINGYGGTTTATDRLNTGTELIADVVTEGLDFAIAYGTAPGATPTSGTGNASDIGYADAITLLTSNKPFIQAEITSWIQAQIDGVIAPFTGAFVYDAVACARDVGYIVDALVYDLTYGGNLETTVAARAYFVDGSPVYGVGEKDETLASYARLKTIIGEVILQTDVSESAGNTEVQVVDGDAGSAGAATAAEDLVQEIYDTLDTDGTLATPVTPDLSWVATPLTTANTEIAAAKSSIQNAVIDHINSTFGTFIYDSAKCRRDSALLKTGATYDIVLGTNYNAIRDGLAYRRGAGQYVLANQLTETLGAITAEGDLVEALLSDGTAITNNTAYWAEVIDIITNGTASANAIVYTDSGQANKTTARTELQTNRATIISDLTSWIASNYPALDYNIATCERDTGYIIDAISYDVQYGGNSAILEATKAYFDGWVSVLPVSQRAIEVAAIEQLKTIVTSYMSGATEETEAATLLDILISAIDAGSLSNIPATVYPTYAWATAGLQTDADTLIADDTVVPAVLQFITDNYTGFVYNHAKCSRDVGYMVDALRFDIMFNSDFRSLKSGMAYRRGLASTGVVLDSQLKATLSSIEKVRSEIKEITSGTSKVISSTELIRDIMISGVAPTSFTFADPTNYNTGFFNARRLITANKQFLIDEVEAYLIDQYNAVWVALTAGEQAAWLVDVGYAIDALRYDLTYRGNLETIVTARSYYVDGVFVRDLSQKVATLAIQTHLASIIDDIATANTITRTTGNTTVQDVTGTAGSAGAAAFAVDRINEIYNTIDSGDAPALISPSIIWTDSAFQQLKAVIDSRKAAIQSAAINYINFLYPDLSYNQVKCSRDVGYIIDAIAYDVIFGSDFRSAKAGMSYRRGITSTEFVIANQLDPTISTINFIEEALTQLTIGVQSKVGTTESANNAFNRAQDIKNIIQNGLDVLPGIILPVPTNLTADLAYATTSNTTGEIAGYSNAADQLAANSRFIQLEVRRWLEDATNGYDTFWATISGSGQDNCIRDVGYIVDAVRYDLTYGGNTQSLIAGSAYYSNFILTIGVDELPATLAAYARMKTVIGQVIAETTVTKSPGNTLTQDVSGTAGSAGSIEFADDRVNDVLDWINNGVPNSTVEIATAWAEFDVENAYTAIVTKKTEIIEDVVYWVEKFWQSITYSESQCRRDAGYMVDAIARDMLTGSNFASIKAGMSYYRALKSTAEVVNNTLEATVGAVNFLMHKVKHVASLTAAASAELIIDDITATINGGARPYPKWKATVNTDAQDLAAAVTIWENKAFIQAEVLEFINTEYPEVTYTEAKCSRDVGMLVDALRYDLTYGGTSAVQQFAQAYYIGNQLQIGAGEQAATVAAYDYMKFLAGDLAQNVLGSPGALQTVIEPKFRDADIQTIGDASSTATVEALLEFVKSILNDPDNSLPTVDIIDITSNVLETATAHGLKKGDEISFDGGFDVLEGDTVYYVNSVPSSTEFTVAQFFNGTTIALQNDAAPGLTATITKVNPITVGLNATLAQQATNVSGSVGSIKTAISQYIATNYPTLNYNIDKCERDVGYIVDAVVWDMLVDSNYRTVIAALSYYRGAQADLVLGAQKTATVQSYRELKNVIASYIADISLGTGRAGYVRDRANKLMDIIINILDKGENTSPEITGTVTYFNDIETINGVDILKANSKFLANEATAYINSLYGGSVSGVTDSDVQFGGAHNFIVNDPIKFNGAVANLSANTVYFVKTVTSDSSVTVSATLGGTQIIILGSVTGTPSASYGFDEVVYRRDIERYVEAIVYDLQYPGNFKALRETELYLNNVNGSERSDLYRVRNSTGVRNQTLNGLRGNLTELNDFGTRRPTAGAYVAHDPGFGPNDTECWITNKSPYIQNVTTFGVGCVGNKIDGALHAGGNRSMVSNDFTQVLSDGIGVWCSGNNSLTELVSVFSYYNYSGYVADYGARIRATNGNSSYGTYGVIAEGTDTGEIPLFCAVNNLSNDAYSANVLTTGESVLRFEFDNAGVNYTNAQYSISGDGFNATVVADEFRDQAVFETRLIDLDDGNGVGGADYITAKNVAQGGNLIQATLAATDTALANAYNGMHIQITAGTGVGQYAKILTFNNGTKIAKVYKPSVDTLTVTSTVAIGNLVTVADTYSLYVNMPIYLSQDIGGLTATTDYYVTAVISSTEFTVSDSEGGTDIVLSDTSAQSVTLYAAGWEHAVPGTPIEVGLDLTTGYTVEPSIVYSAPGFTATATTSDAAVSYQAAAYAAGKFVAIDSAGTGTSYSTDGITWEAGGALPASANWIDVAFGGGTGATATAIVGGLGGSGAVFEAELGELNSIGLPGPTQIARINVINGGQGYSSAPTIALTGGNGNGASAIATVLNGIVQEVTITSTGAGYSAAPAVTAETDKITEVIVTSYGNGYLTAPTITLSGGGASTQASVLASMDNTGVVAIFFDEDIDENQLVGEGYTSEPIVTITDVGAKFVAIAAAGTNNANLLLTDADTDTWNAGTALPNTSFAALTYGNGVFVAVGGGGGSGSAATSTDGISWVSRTTPTLGAGTLTGVTYGAGYYVAINGGGDEAFRSTNGIVWTSAGNLPAAAIWSSVAYGNGRFVAIANSSNEVAISYDSGATWIVSPSMLPSNELWVTVKYGQGLFVAVAEGTDICATSQDGITWTKQTLSASTVWHALAFGNPNNIPTWVALTNTATNVGTKIKTGARAIGRVTEADGSLNQIRMVEPGSGYPLGTVASTTTANTITVDTTENMIVGQQIKFVGIEAAGLADNSLYYINTIPTGNTITVSLIANSGTPVVVETATLTGATFRTGPVVTITDPNSTVVAPTDSRQGNGVLAMPSFTNRGTGYQTATTELGGDGAADIFQASTFMAVKGLYDLPEPGSNVEFSDRPGTFYKLVAISNVIGSNGSYTATFQISPGLTVLQAPLDSTLITTTNKYSQVRLTGHDFLYIGTGNQAATNYPYVDITTAIQSRQQLASNGGRVFFTSTDQDGNFNVGGLFGVQQSTGTATLDADAFNLAGLQSLQLNGIGLGIGSAIITQFSTDPFFTANSDSVVPTQRAIKSYITAQIGGGQSSLNVNTLTAGVVFIANDEITTTSGGQLNITAKMNFTGGIDGAPVALGFFLAR